MKLEFTQQIFRKKKYSNIKFHEIRPVWAELFHTDGRTDKYYESNSHFSQFCQSAQKKKVQILQIL